MKISLPVVILDETLKFFARKFSDGTNPLMEIHYILGVWALYAALMLYSPV